MKTTLFTLLFSLVAIFTSIAQAQIIPLTVDSTQSTLSISLNGMSESSQLSGTTTLDIQSTNPPAGTAQITGLNVVADDGLIFSFPLLVQATTSPGDVTFSMVMPGPAGTIAGNNFSQSNNLFTIGGNVVVSDPFGLAGGNQTIDLSTVQLPLIDLSSVDVTQSGNVITLRGSFLSSQTTDFGELELNATFVATGVVPVSVLKGDVNMDGDIAFNDIPAFIAVLQTGNFQAEADCDCSAVVDFADIPAFITILQGQ